MKPCRICGTVFAVHHGNEKYCSDLCRTSRAQAYQAGYYRSHRGLHCKRKGPKARTVIKFSNWPVEACGLKTLLHKVSDRVETCKTSYRELSRRTGLKRQTIADFAHGQGMPRWDTMNRLLRALDIHLYVAIEKP